MPKEKTVVDEAIVAAKEIGNKEVAEKLGNTSIGDMTMVQPIIPKMFDEDGRPYSKKEIERQVNAFCEEQKKSILTHSIGLAMGIDIPTGLTFEDSVLEDWTRKLGYLVKRVEGNFEVKVNVSGGEYKIIDDNRYNAKLRAIHFALTRHDPDTDEHVQRRLWAEMQAQSSNTDKPNIH